MKTRRQLLTERRGGSLSSAALAIRDRLLQGHTDPAAELQKHIQQGIAGSEVVRVCLVEARNRLMNLPRKMRTQAVQRLPVPLALTVLKHIWKDESLWVPIVFSDQEALLALCDFAVYEGLEDIVLSWAAVEVSVRYAVGPTEGGSPHLWRGSIVRSLITAINVHGSNNSVDKGLNIFFKVMQWKATARQQTLPTSASKINLWPAVVELSSAMTSGKYNRTDPGLYSRFQKVCEDSVEYNRDDQYHFNLARLALHHPSQPDPDLMIRHIHRMLSQYRTQFDTAPHLREPYKRSLRRCHDLLRSLKRVEGSVWVTRVHEAIFEQALDTSNMASK